MDENNEKKIRNVQINKKENFVLIDVNSKIYPLEIVYSAAYVFLDRAYILIDGDPEDKLLVELRLKKTGDLEKLAMEFNNELVNYAVYAVQALRTQGVRDALVQKIFAANTESAEATGAVEACVEEDTFEGLDYQEDPLGIAKPHNSEKGKNTVDK